MKRTMSWMVGTMTMLALSAGFALAGNTNASAAPTNAASAMWTLNQIYNVLDTRTTNITLRGGQTSFVEPTSGPTGTMHTLNEIMSLVTSRVAVAKTGAGIISGYTLVAGEDGYAGMQVGVALASPRCTDNGNGTVRDNLTGLIWLKKANAAGVTTNWAGALSLVAELNTSGTMRGINAGDTSNGGTYQTDWRLPNIRELMSLLDYGSDSPAIGWTGAGNQFTLLQSTSYYWSSTTSHQSSGNAWRLSMARGETDSANTKSTLCYVWAVRGGR